MADIIRAKILLQHCVAMMKQCSIVNSTKTPQRDRAGLDFLLRTLENQKWAIDKH